jgi:peptidoglycan-N-acetylglucosamine deacetylase
MVAIFIKKIATVFIDSQNKQYRMLIEQPPRLYRLLFPGALWRIKPESDDEKNVYLTFDDGPIPETTPWILELLDKYNIKATFFCVGDNVRKYPELYRMLIQKGHHVGNHTFNHVQGILSHTDSFVENAEKAARLIHSPLFRPPHGHMRIPQTWALRKNFKIVMWDVVTRDYSKHVNAEDVFNNVKKYTRNGSIVVFHDSLKAERNMMEALPKSIEWLMSEGYQFKLIDYNLERVFEKEQVKDNETAGTPIPEFVVNRRNF